jgi:hypothetical protein
MRKKAPYGPALLLVAAAVVLLLLVGTYTFLPPLVERMVARSVQQGLGLEERPQVELRSDPPPEMLAGRFSDGRISLGDADLGDVRAEQVAVDLDPFDLDLMASILGGRIESEEPPSGTLRAEVPEEEVSRLAKAGADVPVRDVELEEGRVVVRSEASVLGFDVPISVQGSLAVRGGDLVFQPRRVSALGTPLPEELVREFLSGTDFSYPLRGLPYGVEVTGVEAARDRLVLSGEIRRIPVGG